jgi:hypothetical protein
MEPKVSLPCSEEFSYSYYILHEYPEVLLNCKADTANIGTETALGSNVYSLDSMRLIICYPSHPSDSIA